MKIHLKDATDEELVKFFIWDGLSVNDAINFVREVFRPDMLPVTETLMKSFREYEAGFKN